MAGTGYICPPFLIYAMVVCMSCKKNILTALLFFSIFTCIHSEVSRSFSFPFNQKAEFTEIWGYIYEGDMKSFNSDIPISDLGVFGAGISNYGKLYGLPSRKAFNSFTGRVHLVVAEVSNVALTHFCLDPELPMRGQLIKDILAASIPFDGLQIDFELVQPRDKAHFVSFLEELKAGLGEKPLSVAIPARTRKLTSDAYDYVTLNTIVDRAIEIGRASCRERV